MDLNGWLSICFETVSDVVGNKQRSVIRVLESRERAQRKLWEWRDDSSVIHPDEIEEVLWMDKKQSSNPEKSDYGKRVDSHKHRKSESFDEKPVETSI